MHPIFGILDDCDAPETRMLVIVWGEPGKRVWQYVSPGYPVNHKKYAKPQPFSGHRFVPLDRFGMRAELTANSLLLRVDKSGEPCTATYPDGEPRRWQGKDSACVGIRSGLVCHVLAAIEAHVANVEATA